MGKPTVFYICVAHKTTVLAQTAGSAKLEADFSAEVPATLKNFTDKSNLRAFDQKPGVTFAVLVQGGLTIVVYANDNATREQLYALLKDVAAQFKQKWSAKDWKFAGHLQMQHEFEAELGAVLKEAASFEPVKPSEIEQELEEVKKLATDNLTNVLARSEQLTAVAEQSKDLETNATVFTESSDKLRKTMLCKRFGTILGIVLAIITIILLIVIL